MRIKNVVHIFLGYVMFFFFIQSIQVIAMIETTTDSAIEIDHIKVTDIDLGNYLDEMDEEDKQLLYVTPLPTNATNQEVTFDSEDESVATINAMGRIEALKYGKTNITVYGADGIKRSFRLVVNKAKSEYVAVDAIDLGEYKTTMEEGTKQSLYISFLPTDATDTKISYSSSHEKVATINEFGRISALKEGETVISSKVGSEEQSFILKVEKKKEIKAKEMDLGNLDKVMKVGETRILSPSVLPVEARALNFKYSSSNRKIAIVNDFGRITAKSEGFTVIKVAIGELVKSYELEVKVADENGVTNIELAKYEEEMETEKTQRLVTSILPKDITGLTTYYHSSNPEVAKIDSTGTIEAINSGKTVITISAGNFSKDIEINVVVATTLIKVNKDYLILKPDETFILEAQVLPEKAKQVINYRVLDEEIATIDRNGLITGHSTGQTTIVIDNGFLKSGVTVIVNSDTVTEKDLVHVQKKIKNTEDIIKLLDIDENENIPLSTSMIPSLTTEMLRYIKDENKLLTLKNENYILRIDGESIKNSYNAFSTQFDFDYLEEGLIITIDERLPGKLMLDIKKEKYQLLYLMNSSKNIYELIDSDISDGVIYVDLPGEYLLTNTKQNQLQVNVFIIIGGIITIIIMGVYVVTKRRYWFW